MQLRPGPQLTKVLIITACWTFILVFMYIASYLSVMDLVHLGKLSGQYAFWPDFAGNVTVGICGGLFGGYLLVYRLQGKYRKHSFASGIVRAGITFVALYLTFSVAVLFLMAFLFFLFQMPLVEASGHALENLLLNLRTPSFFTMMCSWGILVTSTQFMLQVSDKFGQGVLWKFLTGRYFHPRDEERVFMFLDLKSSTAIAERLGSKEFFLLLKDLYHDITLPVIHSAGEIYQYVGDEVVITWPVDSGIANENCIHCFFRVADVLAHKADTYQRTYGVVPEFKAGLHIGQATVGEIGVIKKDIVYSGDVLNTTSRIQRECNRYKVNLLISDELLSQIPASGYYENSPIGEIRLRGKMETLRLSSLTLAS